jgi:hypothetical protein
MCNFKASGNLELEKLIIVASSHTVSVGECYCSSRHTFFSIWRHTNIAVTDEHTEFYFFLAHSDRQYDSVHISAKINLYALCMHIRPKNHLCKKLILGRSKNLVELNNRRQVGCFPPESMF